MINTSQKGIALYLTIMVTGLIMVIAFSMVGVFVSQLGTLRDIGNSVLAFCAAETGAERALYGLSKGETGPQWQEELSNGASFTVIIQNPGEGDCPSSILNYCLKSIGVYKEVRRGLRITR
ncbi:MAG: hypothetical protein Q8N56_03165 [bacterium]|nr:hypothetical protein [bacterium]